MKNTLTFFSLVLIISSFFINEKAYSQNKPELIEELVSELHRQNIFNGALVIGEKGKIIFSKGFGYTDFTDSISFTSFTPADGGSNAKTLTAASILLLQNEGMLKLNDPVQKYLPEYPYENTKVFNLITHSTGGINDYDYFFSQTDDSVILSNELLLQILSEKKPDLQFSPNTNFYYDNIGFDLAALIIKRVTGKSYQQFLNKRIFSPLKMDSAYVRYPLITDWKGSRTIGYNYSEDSLKLFDIMDREGFHGGSNIWFSADDLYKWGTSFYLNPVFEETVLDSIIHPFYINNKLSEIVLGAWYHGKHKNAFYYWGSLFGFYSFVYWDKENEFTIAFVSNTNMAQSLRPLFTGALVNIMEDEKYYPVNIPIREKISSENSEQFSGKFSINDPGEVEIFINETKPFLKYKNRLHYRIYIVDDYTMYVPGIDCWLSFTELKENKFQSIHWGSTVLQSEGKRIPR